MNIKNRLYMATIDDSASMLANKYGLGIEIDEFCTAMNMDEGNFSHWNRIVRDKLPGITKTIFHAPFAELFPSAIDPLARDMAKTRYNQAYQLASQYNCHTMVVHSGYIPYIYFKEWFSDCSINFWQEFISDKDKICNIAIENVLEDEPYTLANIIEKINDPNVGICLDTGHAFAQSKLPLTEWIDVFAPNLRHIHLHNNDGVFDYHWPLNQGKMDMKQIIPYICEKAPNATITLENMDTQPSLDWLQSNGFL